MRNATRVAMEFLALLPASETPEETEGYEGFYHCLGIESSCEHASMSFIIRDHDREKFAQRKATFAQVADTLNRKYGDGVVSVKVYDQYFNMKEKIDAVPHVVDIAKEAMERIGVTPRIQAIRGGTDGAQLSFKGLPCPNIFAGGLNFHGPHEFLPVPNLEKAMQTVVEICRLTAAKH